MRIVVVDIWQTTHTCAANPEPHVFDTRRRIIAVTDGGPCRKPVTVRSGDVTTTVPCGQSLPSERHCDACRTVVRENSITTRHLNEIAD